MGVGGGAEGVVFSCEGRSVSSPEEEASSQESGVGLEVEEGLMESLLRVVGRSVGGVRGVWVEGEEGDVPLDGWGMVMVVYMERVKEIW